MLTWFRWTVAILFWTALGLTLHYSLPKRDIARIVGVEIKREDIGPTSWFWAAPDSGSADGVASRDVRFIETVRANDRAKVFRNEDTGLGWPFYFKFDSADLQAEARNLVSDAEDPRWAVIRHYGWRIQFLSIYPNAVSVKEIADVNAGKSPPWFNIAFLTVFAAVSFALHRRWRRFKSRRLDPIGEALEDRLDAATGWLRPRLATLRQRLARRGPDA